jgi:hypothetical protein
MLNGSACIFIASKDPGDRCSYSLAVVLRWSNLVWAAVPERAGNVADLASILEVVNPFVPAFFLVCSAVFSTLSYLFMPVPFTCTYWLFSRFRYVLLQVVP